MLQLYTGYLLWYYKSRDQGFFYWIQFSQYWWFDRYIPKFNRPLAQLWTER